MAYDECCTQFPLHYSNLSLYDRLNKCVDKYSTKASEESAQIQSTTPKRRGIVMGDVGCVRGEGGVNCDWGLWRWGGIGGKSW